MKDLLSVESAQRVDLRDFLYGVNDSQQEIHRELMAQLVLNPNASSAYKILEGFAIDCPSGKQVRVTRGRALLGQRDGAAVVSAVLTTTGDATKIVDINSFSAGTYGVYIRFELVDGDSEVRSFWDPSGPTEFSATIPTRRKANWSLRVESSSPGGEWMKIAEVDQVTLATPTTGITDQRDFYFEGTVDSAYDSGWSTDGGGVAADRNATRAADGVHDLATFAAAMRQCVEDIKGRGLKRWWDRGIGGMNIGFDADPVSAQLAIANGDFYLDYGATTARVNMDGSTTFFGYNRTASEYRWEINNQQIAVMPADGLRVLFGLHVGSDTVAVEDEIRCDGDIHVGGRQLYFGIGSDDWIEYGVTAANSYSFFNNSVEEMRLGSDGLRITNGLYVGSLGVSPTDNAIYAEGDITAGANVGSSGYGDFPGNLGTGDPGVLSRRSARNSITCVCQFSIASSTPTYFSVNSHNVASIANSGTGLYTITTHQNVKTNSVVLVNMMLSTHYAFGYVLTNTTVRIQVFLRSTDALADIVDGDFGVVVVGPPG